MKEQVLVWVLSSSVENLNLASPTTFLSRLYERASVGLGVIKFSRKFESCITDHFFFLVCMKGQVLVWVLSSSVESLNFASPTTFYFL